VSYGVEAVAELVAGSRLSYSVSVRQLRDEFALTNVNIDERGNSMMVAGILGQTDADRFMDREDLLETLEPLFEVERKERQPGILGRVKLFLIGRQ
jgi:hypothetical protein